MGTRTKTNSRKRDILVEQRDNARRLADQACILAARLYRNDGVPIIDQELSVADLSALSTWANEFFREAGK